RFRTASPARSSRAERLPSRSAPMLRDPARDADVPAAEARRSWSPDSRHEEALSPPQKRCDARAAENRAPRLREDPAPRRSLTAALDVVLHELFRVLFEHGVDLVEKIVHLLLQLLALLSELLPTLA